MYKALGHNLRGFTMPTAMERSYFQLRDWFHYLAESWAGASPFLDWLKVYVHIVTTFLS